MPPPELDDLPEPHDLHNRLSADRPLDWGDPLPSKAQIAAEFGAGAATRGLEFLTRALEVEKRVTADFTAAVPSGTVPHNLQNRMKSPHSLARKLRKTENYWSPRDPEDVLRYTVVAPEPDDLVEAAAGIVRDLQSKGWVMDSAHHSYVDGSRYKGLHAFMHCQGELVELQIHSQESLEVKTRTTPLYEVERDPRQSPPARAAARAACISMSVQMRQPIGIAELTELGGVPVSTRSYGGTHSTALARPGAKTPSTAQVPAKPGHPAPGKPRDGIER
ncbi:hypothetical protein F1D05_11325 [Kribbella qitaiheensis]|uniref:RelA/SpoT domain-containing protein n=1 Tax=Kribbella qitaiheensis TaxID=1544730 RepID=A0A7G6WWL3_9ACTN|nr:hypothetical protein [Kribbella qitaiheensis]QNE18378.1 hypothetical protein F1D05_11325 [Kribbella qitaiheensis]